MAAFMTFTIFVCRLDRQFVLDIFFHFPGVGWWPGTGVAWANCSWDCGKHCMHDRQTLPFSSARGLRLLVLGQALFVVACGFRRSCLYMNTRQDFPPKRAHAFQTRAGRH